jgi:hypothetical protein
MNDNEDYISILTVKIYLPRLLWLQEPLNRVVRVKNLENAH